MTSRKRLWCIGAMLGAGALSAGARGQAIYSNIPSILDGNYVSQCLECVQGYELGDRVTFGGTNRVLSSVTVTMSSWARSEDYGNAVSFTHPMTMNIYEAGPDAIHPGALLGSVTQTMTIPFRPTVWNDPTDGHAFGGIAANVTFDFSSLRLVLPNTVVYGVAFNTADYGAAPIHAPGPYNSLNFALNSAPGGGITVGSNDNLDDVFFNSTYTGFYTDHGLAGVGIFRADTAWTGYTPMVQFNTAAVTLDPTTTCAHTGGDVVVNIDMKNAIDPIVGGQFFLQYDSSVLQFVSATAGSAPFTLPVYFATPGSGQIDFAVGVPGGGPGTSVDSTMATLTFTALHDVCSTAGLVSFRPHSPPTRLTNNVGAAISVEAVDMPAFTIDSVAPSITCPSNITVNADAGLCTATLGYNNPFDVAPAVSNTEAPGVFYTDRFNPAGFTSASFDGGNRLKVSISADDYQTPVPNFYNTQGRGYDVNLPAGQTMGIDLFVDPAWLTGDVRRADVWGVAYDGSNNISGFPILGFTSNDPNDDLNSRPANPTPRWRVWDEANDAWIDLVAPVTSGWHRLEISLTHTSFVHKLDGVTVSTLPNNNSIRIKSILIQAYNFDESYDVYWDNLTTGPAGPIATDTCSTNLGISYVRSDNPLLTLQDPFPLGGTTVTWTATDSCGNSSSCPQLVTVNAFNTVTATVELSPAVESGPFTRCISFGLPSAGCSTFVDVPMTFSGGTATASFDVPCGVYSCLTARDKRHTLRSTANTGDGDFSISGTQYVANFTGSTHWLVGGNLNDDSVIDILDFGVFVGQYNAHYGTGDTTCSTPFPHADITGDGIVFTGDFTFIADNFLKVSDADCCGGLRPAGISSIPVARLIKMGHPEMAAADLNHDGWVDQADMAIFASNGVPHCGTADFNCDGDVGTDADIESFFSCLAGNCPSAPCTNSADFNGDGDIGTDSDIESFFRVLSGGHC